MVVVAETTVPRTVEAVVAPIGVALTEPPVIVARRRGEGVGDEGAERGERSEGHAGAGDGECADEGALVVRGQLQQPCARIADDGAPEPRVGAGRRVVLVDRAGDPGERGDVRVGPAGGAPERGEGSGSGGRARAAVGDRQDARDVGGERDLAPGPAPRPRRRK